MDELCRAGEIMKNLIKKAQDVGFELENDEGFFYAFIRFYTKY